MAGPGGEGAGVGGRGDRTGGGRGMRLSGGRGEGDEHPPGKTGVSVGTLKAWMKPPGGDGDRKESSVCG